MQLTRQEIETSVNRIMTEEFEIEEDKLDANALLGDDFDLDSLDAVDLVVALEKTFNCRIPEQEARAIRTLGDIHDRVQARLTETVQEKAS